MNGTVRIGQPEFEGRNRVRFGVAATNGARRFIRDDFVCEYDIPVDRLPARILNIPVLANLLPLVWMLDARLCVDEVDDEFHGALPEMRAALQSMYPAIEFGGRLEVGNVATTEVSAQPRRIVALYSGGVDSTATALAHRDDDLTLAMIWGVDIEFHQEKAWNAMRSRAVRFGEAHGVKTTFVRSNLRRFVSERRLNERFGSHLGHWWRGVAGLALLGSMAPLSHATGASTIYIPATHWNGANFPWGSDPSIDERVRWSGVRCIHDLFIPRGEKIRRIVGHAPPVEVIVCRSGQGFAGTNCGRCEKCCRTIVQFLLAGADPRRHGFPMTNATLEHIRDAIQTGRFYLNRNRTHFWKGIQHGIAAGATVSGPGVEAFFSWLAEFDFDDALRRSDEKGRLFRRAVGLAGRFIPQRLRSSARRAYYVFFDDI